MAGVLVATSQANPKLKARIEMEKLFETLAKCLLCVVLFVVVLALVGRSNTESYQSYDTVTGPDYSAPGYSSEPNWDAARDAGYYEADIDAAKEYGSTTFQSLSNDEQEDRMIYNTLKQMGFSDNEANAGVNGSSY